jgi:hypothetical protein
MANVKCFALAVAAVSFTQPAPEMRSRTIQMQLMLLKRPRRLDR